MTGFRNTDKKEACHTWDSGAKACGMEHHQPVLQAASAHTLSTNQNQRLSLEWRHLCHFLIDLQLMSVKLCLKDGTISDQSKM